MGMLVPICLQQSHQQGLGARGGRTTGAGGCRALARGRLFFREMLCRETELGQPVQLPSCATAWLDLSCAGAWLDFVPRHAATPSPCLPLRWGLQPGLGCGTGSVAVPGVQPRWVQSDAAGCCPAPRRAGGFGVTAGHKQRKVPLCHRFLGWHREPGACRRSHGTMVTACAPSAAVPRFPHHAHPYH